MDEVSRIFELVDKLYPEQQAFAAAIGVSPKTVSVWRTGRGKSYTKYLPRIASALHTSVEYIVSGELGSESGTVSADDAKLLRAYHQAPTPIREIVDTALKPYET